MKPGRTSTRSVSQKGEKIKKENYFSGFSRLRPPY
jgi:hypothetical protein